jgi:hypothetical protein
MPEADSAAAVEFARSRLQAVERRIARVTVRVNASTAAPLSFWIDSKPLGQVPPQLMRLDPGRHWLGVRAQGHEDSATSFVVTEGEQRELLISLVPSAPAAAPRRSDKKAKPKHPDGPWGMRHRTAAYVLGGVGVAALVVGGVYHAKMVSLADERNQHCRSGCDADAEGLHNDALSAATVSTIALGVGVASVLAGGWFYFNSPKPTKPDALPISSHLQLTPQLVFKGAGMAVGGKW